MLCEVDSSHPAPTNFPQHVVLVPKALSNTRFGVVRRSGWWREGTLVVGSADRCFRIYVLLRSAIAGRATRRIFRRPGRPGISSRSGGRSSFGKHTRANYL